MIPKIVSIEWGPNKVDDRARSANENGPISRCVDRLKNLAKEGRLFRHTSVEDLIAQLVARARPLGIVEIIGHGSPGALEAGSSFGTLTAPIPAIKIPQGKKEIWAVAPRKVPRNQSGLLDNDAAYAFRALRDSGVVGDETELRLLGCMVGLDPGLAQRVSAYVGAKVTAAKQVLSPDDFGEDGFEVDGKRLLECINGMIVKNPQPSTKKVLGPTLSLEGFEQARSYVRDKCEITLESEAFADPGLLLRRVPVDVDDRSKEIWVGADGVHFFMKIAGGLCIARTKRPGATDVKSGEKKATKRNAKKAGAKKARKAALGKSTAALGKSTATVDRAIPVFKKPDQAKSDEVKALDLFKKNERLLHERASRLTPTAGTESRSRT